MIFINAKIVFWIFFLLLIDLKMDVKVESSSFFFRCKFLYDNGFVEWKFEVYYLFYIVYNNNNKVSYRIYIGIWWRNILFRVLGKNIGFLKLGGGMECLLYIFVLIIYILVNIEFILDCLILKNLYYICLKYEFWVLVIY